VYKLIGAALVLLLTIAFTPTIEAETVFVKYRGSVSLEQFRCSYPSSSFVHRVCYRAENRYLVVLLDSTYYHYCRMPSSIVEQWLSSQSTGRFYSTYIRGNYDCREGGIPSD
jgi:hypothetical protein